MKYKQFVQRYYKSRQRGFSLVEVLIVLAIIAVLSVFVIASLTKASDRAFDAKSLTAAKQFQKSVETFMLLEDRWPTAGSTNHPDREFPIGSNCSEVNGSTHFAFTNWEETIADMGDYLPAGFHEGGNWPYCLYFFRQEHPNCDAQSNYDYGIVFGVRDSTWQNIDTFIDSLDNTRACVYPL